MDAVIALALEADSEDDRKKVETTIGVVGASLNDLMVWLPRALFPCALVLIVFDASFPIPHGTGEQGSVNAYVDSERTFVAQAKSLLNLAAMDAELYVCLGGDQTGG